MSISVKVLNSFRDYFSRETFPDSSSFLTLGSSTDLGRIPEIIYERDGSLAKRYHQ